ncbi:hypothetical protein N0V84_003294 [Fusarium piperis]|uniref:Fungal STAND N-terminal Goodbye domain-containing protein n=1 Tax=Fusarium piperis TaxID=1435070 RepID=A0A9W8WHQ5_9HYPO|nr:hypothetical protein N0V84_003294 [Fusarium piperis]
MSTSPAIDAAMDSAWRTDIGTLWTAAVAKHNQKVGIKFKLDQSKAMNTPWNSTTMQATLNKLTAEFEKERDSLGHFSDRIKAPLQVTLKIAKGATEVILRTASTIGAIAGSVFAPAPILAEALVFVLQATQKVSGQLDEIQKFFEVTANFFRRLSVLEGRLPDGPQFGQQLVDVFDRLLGFIVDAQIFVGRGKFINFFKELAKPSTPLSDAHALFQEQLTRLDSSALYCTLGLSVDINKNVADIRASVDLIIDDTHHIVGQIDGLGTNIVDLQVQIGSFRRDFSTFSHEIRHKHKTQDASKQISDTVTVDHASYQSNVLRTLRSSFNVGDTEGLHQRRLTRMLSSRLPGTCEWIHQQPAYHTLLDGTSQFLLLQGGRHTGRSMLSSFIFEHLKTSKRQLSINKSGTQTEAGGISVAYFCFGQEFGGRNSVDDMIRCCVIQIVEQDAAYRKWAMDHCLGQKSRGESTNPTWHDHFVHRFSPSESDSPQPWLFLVLDDVDSSESKERLLKFQKRIAKNKLRISLILTTTSDMEIDIPKESKIVLGEGKANAENHDLRTFTKHLAMNLSPLNDLPPETRESLVDGVCQKATSKSSLGFQDTIRLPANVLMFKMLSHVLTEDMDVGEQKDKNPITVCKKTRPPTIVAKAVVRGLARVFSNENGVLKVLEANVPEADWGGCQSLLGTDRDEIHDTLRILLYWLRLVPWNDMTDLPKGPQDWLKAVEPEGDGQEPHARILEQLAARHSDNWGAAQFPSSAYNSFRFAHQALRDRDNCISPGERSNSQDAEPEARTEAILEVGEGLRTTLKGQENESERIKATTASVAIAMALRYDGLYEPALKEALNAAEIIEGQDDHGKAVFNAFKNAYDGARDDESQGDAEPKFSIRDYETLLQQLMGSGNSFTLGSKEAKLRFDVYNRIGRICYGMSQDKTDLAVEAGADSLPEKALEKRGYLEAARVAFVTALETKEEGRNIIRTHWLKAKVEALLGDDKCALESVGRAVETAKKSQEETTTVFFDELVHELSKGQDGPANVLQLLELVGHAQLVKGFMAETHQRIHKAAKKQGKSAAEKVKNTYAEAVIHLVEGEDAAAQMLSICWADFVRFVWAEFQAEAAEEAEEILRRALRVKVAGSVDTTIRIGWRLADMFLEQFLGPVEGKQEPVDLKGILATKQAALDKMEDLISQLQGLQADFEPYQSQMSIPLSVMRRKLSPALTFLEGADQTFRGCVKTLTDEHQDNDAPSFQVLAKVLCLVPGLKRHAEIAASCQFYVIDEQLFTGQTQSPVTCSYCEKRIGGDAEAEVVYLCCYCTNTFVCKSCYDNKESTRSGKTIGEETDAVVLQPACRPEHIYVAARGDGWGGTKDGKMVLKGEDGRELSFQEWLDELKGEWEGAWKKFWREPTI